MRLKIRGNLGTASLKPKFTVFYEKTMYLTDPRTTDF